MSTTESELIAASTATREAVWLKMLSQELGYQQEKMILQVDNNGVLQLCNNPVHHSRTKHIDILQYYVRDKVKDGTIDLQRVDTSNNVADIFTKPVAKNIFNKHLMSLGMTTVR